MTVAASASAASEASAEKGEEVDGTAAAPDIFPHSHNFHVPFFITIIRNDEPLYPKKQQPFTLNMTSLLDGLPLSHLNGRPIKKSKQ